MELYGRTAVAAENEQVVVVNRKSSRFQKTTSEVLLRDQSPLQSFYYSLVVD